MVVYTDLVQANSTKLGSKHPFHLVTLSPWPLFTALGAFFLVLGVVGYLQQYARGGALALFGLGIVVASVTFWFRDIIVEGTYEGHHTVEVQRGLALGMILFILSEVMFFFGFFWAFFHSALAPSIDFQTLDFIFLLGSILSWVISLVKEMLIRVMGAGRLLRNKSVSAFLKVRVWEAFIRIHFMAVREWVIDYKFITVPCYILFCLFFQRYLSLAFLACIPVFLTGRYVFQEYGADWRITRWLVFRGKLRAERLRNNLIIEQHYLKDFYLFLWLRRLGHLALLVAVLGSTAFNILPQKVFWCLLAFNAFSLVVNVLVVAWIIQYCNSKTELGVRAVRQIPKLFTVLLNHQATVIGTSGLTLLIAGAVNQSDPGTTQYRFGKDLAHTLRKVTGSNYLIFDTDFGKRMGRSINANNPEVLEQLQTHTKLVKGKFISDSAVCVGPLLHDSLTPPIRERLDQGHLLVRHGDKAYSDIVADSVSVGSTINDSISPYEKHRAAQTTLDGKYQVEFMDGIENRLEGSGSELTRQLFGANDREFCKSQGVENASPSAKVLAVKQAKLEGAFPKADLSLRPVKRTGEFDAMVEVHLKRNQPTRWRKRF